MTERVKFQFFDSEWAKKHALFSSDEMCEICDLPLPHGPIFHTDEGELLDIRLSRVDRAMTSLQEELRALNELRERHRV